MAGDEIAGIVDWLAVRLSQIESGLEAAAGKSARHGAQIGTDGIPPQVCYGPPANAREATEQEWANAYQQYHYQECMQAAQDARSEAAGALGSMCEQVASRAGMDRGRHQHDR